MSRPVFVVTLRAEKGVDGWRYWCSKWRKRRKRKP